MAKSIADRATDSFKDDDRESISTYLDWTRTTLADYAQNNRRLATLLLITVAIFELVAYSRNSKITVGSFVVERGSIVLDFLPAVVAYLYFQIIVDLNKADGLQMLFTAVFKIWSEKAEENDLDTSLNAPAPIYWNMNAGNLRKSNTYPADRVETFGSLTMGIVVILGVLAFQVQAYSVLFASSGSKLALWLISLSITLFCLIAGLIAVVANNDADDPPRRPTQPGNQTTATPTQPDSAHPDRDSNAPPTA